MKASRSPWLLLFLLILSGCVFNDLSQHLKTNGVTANATILEVWETGTTVNDNPVIGMRVEVKPLRHPPFTAKLKMLVSIVHIPQYQPGEIIPVRFDPNNLADIAVDTGTDNPYHDHFSPTDVEGSEIEPASATPTLYGGSLSLDDDYAALLENKYALIGVSIVEEGGSDPQLAVKQGAELGAELVVFYGPNFAAPSTLTALPYRREGPPEDKSLLKLLPSYARNSHVAAYWAKAKP